MERFGLRNDQWEGSRTFLPGREGHVGGTAEDNRTVRRSGSLPLVGMDVPGVIYRGFGTGNRFQ